MKRHYRLPLRTGPKNVSTSVSRRRGAPSILTTGLFALGGVFALFAVGFATFILYKHFSAKSSVGSKTASSSIATPSPILSPLAEGPDQLQPLADPNRSPSGSPALTPETPAPESSPPVLSSAPATSATPAPFQGERASNAEPVNPAKGLSKTARKALEKKRETAERKRAQLEQMYQNHEISTEVYNKGEREYREEIQKYRNEMNTGN